MPRVFVPPPLRDLTGGVDVVEVSGATVAEVIEHLERQFPGARSRLCEGDSIRPGWSVAVGGSVANLGLRQRVEGDVEIHFLPAIGGGS